MMYKIILAIITVTVTPMYAIADLQTPQGTIIECFCTDRYGERHELGDIICLNVDDRSFLAKCEMAQNNPFWRDQKQGCDSSKIHNDFFDDVVPVIPASLMTPIQQ